MKKHIIIYLDQNYLSNITKARFGLLKDPKEAKFWLTLYKNIKQAVNEDKVSCPISEFHITEAMFNTQLEKKIAETDKEISGGLQFRRFQDILDSQIKEAAATYLKVRKEKKEGWKVAFISNPHSKYAERVKGLYNGKIQLYAHHYLTDAEIEVERQRKLTPKQEMGKSFKKYGTKSRTWQDLLLESKLGIINAFMGNLARQSFMKEYEDICISLGTSNAEKIITRTTYLKENFTRINNFWEFVGSIGLNLNEPEMINKFLRSKELLDSPFIDINGSIWAVVSEKYFNGRDPDDGDFYDVPILSSALPYCDILTTDAFMKEILVDRLRFDSKYNVRVFSAKNQDRQNFLDFIKNLIH